MKPIRTGVVVTVILAASVVMGWAQRGGGGQMPSQPAPTGMGSIPSANSNRSGFPMGRDSSMSPMGMPDPMGGRLAEQQARTRNSERQKKLESDTERLMGLVNDLKDQMQNEKNIPPADLSKRAEEIEKLARSVKDRMKG